MKFFQLSRPAAVLLAALTLCAPQPASACGFHMVKAEKTAADWLIDATHLVLARPDPDRPMRYQPVHVLRGGEGPGPLPFLVDSTRRRTLALNSEDALLFAAAEDGKWVMVAYADETFRSVMDMVLKNATLWSTDYSSDRFHAFEGLLDHPDPAIRQLALSEVDKAPYAMLRGIGQKIPPEQILDDLWTFDGYPYQPIRILLLGIGGSDVAREEVDAYMTRTQHWDWADNLGAFSTALIELDGEAGIARLEQMFLSDDEQPLDKLEMVVAALAEHNSAGDPALAPAVSDALARFAAARPKATPMIARQFAARNDWTQAALMEPVMKNRGSIPAQDLVSVAVYLAQAKAAAADPATPSEG